MSNFSWGENVNTGIFED